MGATVCDMNYAYVIMGSTTTESDYINLGYTNIGMVSVSTHNPCYDCNDVPYVTPIHCHIKQLHY